MTAITIIPASCKTSLATIRALLSFPDPSIKLTGIYRDLSKVPHDLLSHPQFTPLQGDIDDPSLELPPTDLLFHTTPNTYTDADVFDHAKRQTENVKAAILKSATVKKVVLMSTMGAQYSSGTGELKANHAAETTISTLPLSIQKVYVRCSWFMENWASELPNLLSDKPFFYSTISPADFPFPHIAVRDIGKTCAQELLSTEPPKSNPYIFELQGRSYSSNDVKKTFEELLGREVEMRVVPKEGLLDYYRQAFSEHVAREYTEMNLSFLEGGILHLNPEPTPGGEIRRGETELKEVLEGLLQGRV
ncbi:hypothetical protein QBC41DRAFT_275155 [Cercophora samala]|uniref:NAD(P)-binding domain-containing protein n=1 Tax=Cercophora samala TaxID=330535 RepID=A0AA39ZF14_9PEZI|nr:hypothetical protein QBC41DRAFT_275155 [Cercophora samala]